MNSRNHEPTKTIAKEIRSELKSKFPTCTFSVTSDHSEIRVTLMSWDKSPFQDGSRTGYEQLNHYYLDNYLEEYYYRPASWEGVKCLTPEAVEMLKEVVRIANRKNWDDSDIQTDYFSCHYYFSLHIGKWDKEFSVI